MLYWCYFYLYSDYYPKASLTLETGQPVMHLHGSVILKLNNEDDGLREWKCFVYRGHETKKIKFNITGATNSLDFQPRALYVPETSFWCTNGDETQRSNLVTIKTSGRPSNLHIQWWSTYMTTN